LRIERALRASRWSFAALQLSLDVVRGAAAIVDGAGRIVLANLRAQGDLPGLRAWIADARRGDRRRVEVIDVRTPGAPTHQLILEPTPARTPRAERVAARAEAWGLTPRQQQVLLAVVDGLSNQQIADDLGIALSTVEIHVSAILKRSGCGSRAALAAAVWR
jgi:DNA-binding CsgD family transcriptional regulator